MFTGIVTAIGTVRALTPIGADADMRIEIATPWPDTAAVAIGASISCAGCCLTAVAVGADFFAVQASAETLSKTLLGTWRVGTRLNLERALRMGDELGGHIVSGHCDGVGTLLSRAPEGGSLRLAFRAPDALSRFIAPKGSIAVDGVSLTVNDVQGAVFGVNIIPHTAQATTLGALVPGDGVNLEIDMLARYVARLAETASVKDAP
jgi:riboflavin synthase